MTDQWTFWRATLAGDKPEPPTYPGEAQGLWDVTAESLQSGYYRSGNVPIAIWRDEAGALHLRRDGMPTKAASICSIWPRLYRDAVTKEDYDRAVQDGVWPDSPPWRGHNLPTDPFERAKAMIDAEAEQAVAFLATPISDQVAADKAAAWATRVGELAKEADAMRAAGAEPIKVKFDLFEEFSVQKAANGGCSADLSARAEGESPPESGTCQASDAGSPDSGCDGNMNARASVARAASTVRRVPRPDAGSPDSIQSEGDRRYRKFSIRWKRARARVKRIKAKDARRRKHAAHVFTTDIIRQASAIELTAPASIKDETRSGKGDARSWGAAVQIKALLNRHILGFAPAMTSQMLAYKAAEAGIPFFLIEDEAPVISVGNDLVAITKAARRARRQLKDKAA